MTKLKRIKANPYLPALHCIDSTLPNIFWIQTRSWFAAPSNHIVGFPVFYRTFKKIGTFNLGDTKNFLFNRAIICCWWLNEFF